MSRSTLYLTAFDRFSSFAPFISRIVVGPLLAYHGFSKLADPAGFAGFVAKIGFPAPTLFAWAAILSELVGGILLALGLLTRWAAVFSGVTLAVAYFIAHVPKDGFLGKGEYALVLFIISVSLFFSGAGKYSLDERLGPWLKRSTTGETSPSQGEEPAVQQPAT